MEQISISAKSPSELRAIRVKANMLLESRTGGVKLVTLDGETKMADNVLGTFKTVILCVAVVALIVGGIGIMNMMYMSVNERVKEIGIRKALGARQNQILLQFMLEAVLLAISGGVLGLICGILLALAASALADVPFIIPLYAPFIGTGFSAAVGIAFRHIPGDARSQNVPGGRAEERCRLNDHSYAHDDIGIQFSLLKFNIIMNIISCTRVTA